MPRLALGEYLGNTFLFENVQIVVPSSTRVYVVMAGVAVAMMATMFWWLLPPPDQALTWPGAGPLFANFLNLLVTGRPGIVAGCLVYLVIVLGLAAITRGLTAASVNQLRLTYCLLIIGAVAASIDLLTLAILSAGVVMLFAVVATVAGAILFAFIWLRGRK